MPAPRVAPPPPKTLQPRPNDPPAARPGEIRRVITELISNEIVVPVKLRRRSSRVRHLSEDMTVFMASEATPLGAAHSFAFITVVSPAKLNIKWDSSGRPNGPVDAFGRELLDKFLGYCRLSY